jgi:RNA polymerase sigma-70 factor (ECF subfamily)
MRTEVAQAIELLKSETPDAMDRALALLQQTIFSFSMRVCQQREDAEDTMQDVLVKSLPLLSRFENPKALLVWLYKVAKSRCLMSRRKSKFAPQQELSLEELMPHRAELAALAQGGGINPESFAIHSQEAQGLREALQKLPPHYRIVLVLRDMEDLTDDEVAEITGLRTGTVRVRLHRARLFVRRELSKRWKPASPGMVKTIQTEVRPNRCKALFAELSNYVDEQLDDSMCEKLQKHMDGCEPCKAFLASLQATIEECRKIPADCLNSKQAAKLRKQLLDRLKQISAIPK